jgi:hypothetical protein
MQHLEHDDRSWRARVLRHFRLAETVEMGIRSLAPIYAPTPLSTGKRGLMLIHSTSSRNTRLILRLDQDYCRSLIDRVPGGKAQ